MLAGGVLDLTDLVLPSLPRRKRLEPVLLGLDLVLEPAV